MRISGRAFFVLSALVVLAIIYATGQVAPAETAYQAQMRVWLAARATGIAALVLLTLQVVLGLVLSHPTNQTTWRLSKRLFPWHEHLLLFTASLLADPYRQPGRRPVCRRRGRRRPHPGPLGVPQPGGRSRHAGGLRAHRDLDHGSLHAAAAGRRLAEAPPTLPGRARPGLAPRRPGRHRQRRAARALRRLVRPVVAAAAHRYWVIRRTRTASRPPASPWGRHHVRPPPQPSASSVNTSAATIAGASTLQEAIDERHHPPYHDRHRGLRGHCRRRAEHRGRRCRGPRLGAAARTGGHGPVHPGASSRSSGHGRRPSASQLQR